MQNITLKFRLLLITFLLVNICYSQNEKEALFSIDDDDFTTSEFIKVYNKNLDLVTNEDQKSVDGYLKLFIDYQLKLKEAKRLGLHEDKKYQDEFKKYKNQLQQKYINDNEARQPLIKEAYERYLYDVKASHALVKLDELAKDTTEAINKVSELRDEILANGFKATKEKYHDGKNVFIEDLGYFSVFAMVYDFENAVFNTAAGETSMPFRTRFGYHVVNVEEKKPSKGYITLAHIMISHKQKDSTIVPENRIKEIYKKLEQGETFEALAKQFSDDKSTAERGGAFSAFRRGKLNSKEFEDAGFALEKDGDFSKPVKTKYGWHIVKRLKLEPLKSFDDIEIELANKVKRDTRSKLINEIMVKKLKQNYTVEENKSAKNYFVSILNDNYFKKAWENPENFTPNTTLFKINNKVFSYGDFSKHLLSQQVYYSKKDVNYKNVIDKEYKAFFEKSIFQFRKDNLENENQEYADIVTEYRDGLLLFDLMEKEIWNKASEDSIALKSYYNSHKDNYKWNTRVDVLMASSADKKSIEKASRLIKKNNDKKAMSAVLNADGKTNVIFTETAFDVTSSRLPKNLELKKGISKIYAHNNAFHVFLIKDILPASNKTFKEAKGNIIRDYQTQLENDFLTKLRHTFKVKINDNVLSDLKQQLNK